MLDKIVAFSEVPKALLNRLEGGATLIEPTNGTRMFIQGDAADSVYVVVGGDGHVRVGAVDRNSKSLMVELFGPGDIFGEIGVIERSVRTAEAVVHGRLRLLRIPDSLFLEALSCSPELGIALCRVLAARLRRTFELLQSATFETLEVRLARQLIYLADLSGRRGEQGIRLDGRYRQSDLADLLGATPRSIITVLNGWRASGRLLYDAKKGIVTIRDERALRALSEI